MTLPKASIVISGTGMYVPEKIVRNDELPAHLDTSDEWIRSRSGIGQRHLAAPGENASDMGAKAAQKALAKAGVTADHVDLIIVATMSPDYPFPSVACIIQGKLGMRQVAAFDVHAACSGFLYALETATRLMQSGNYRHALVIGAEKMSSVLDWQDRGTCVLFGDGAGAVVLSQSSTAGVGVLDSLLCADGTRPELLYCPAGGSVRPVDALALDERAHTLKMNGKEIFKVAVRLMADASIKLLERNGLTVADIDCVIPHQANVRIIEALCKQAGIPQEKVFLNIERYANTSGASIPIALSEANESGRIRPGSHVLFVAFGGGLTWATSLVKWHA